MKRKDKGYKGPYERHKRYLEDNGAEIMMHGDEIYLREYVAGKTQYTHWPAKRGVLLYNWLANHIEELGELAHENLPTPEAQAELPDPESFAGLLAQVIQQLKELDANLEEVNDERQHQLNPLLRSWLLQLQVLKSFS
jgi:hypothetical protein